MLVAFDSTHRAYCEAIASALGAAFQDAEVRAADAGALGNELLSFRPNVVVSDAPEPENSGAFAWIELAIEPLEESNVRVGEDEWRLINPGFEELARIVELASRGDDRSQ